MPLHIRCGLTHIACCCLFLLGIMISPPQTLGEELSREAVVSRVRSDIEFFASDDQEGRGLETKGIERSAERIMAEYQKFGLLPGMPEGSYRQPFEVTLGDVVISEVSRVKLTAPNGSTMDLKLGDEYQPIRRGKNSAATGGLVFLGYGITSEDDAYDDYASIDVEGKIVVVIRREPQGYDGGAFKGTATTSNAYIDRKLELMSKAKAAAVLFVNDFASCPTPEKDELATPSSFGNDGDTLPFAHVKQAVVDRILAATPLKTSDGSSFSSLREVEQYIDTNLKPVSQELTGWSADVVTKFQANTVIAYNLIGIIEGEGPLSDETIVIGGHYDHLGFGGFGSRTPNRRGEIHNGADDNASGTAAVVELARRIASGPKPRRRMVFICFSGEERGLIGSNYYVKHPVIPLADTVAMLNFDMIGNLKNNVVEVNGVGSAMEFRNIALNADNATPINITIIDSAFAGSDHLPFYQKGIPVMFCFTGMTSIYHTPDDDFKTLNIEGAVSVIDYSEQLLRRIDELEKPPTFVSAQPRNRRAAVRSPYLGIQPDLAASGTEGIVIRSVREDSPAAASGLQTGDVIISVGETKVEGYQTLIETLIAAKPGDKLKVTFKRGDEEKQTEVTLGEPRR
ncbi:MAG TPA: M28 family peptidase [Planctomycetaceae bacterium]|nr:M28 family peptidase [Planctomycetaceae bacterium]